jgi:hypothetical protein
MSKIKRRRLNSSGPQKHVRLHRWMLSSPAHRSLSPAARALLVELYDLYNGQNNGEIFLSQREAARRLGVGKNLAGKAVGELKDRGFIRIQQQGSFKWKIRHATQWILTEYPYAGQLATKDFMRWSAGPKTPSIAPSGAARSAGNVP